MVSDFVEKREARMAAARRRYESLDIAVGMLIRRLGPIDDFLALLDDSNAAPRLAKALRTELMRRRGGRRA